MADDVAEPSQERDAQRGEDELGGLKPVDVTFMDVEVGGQLWIDRCVKTLQDAAGELDRDQEADDGDQSGYSLHGWGGQAHRGSLSMKLWYHRMPTRKSSTPMRSSKEWIASRCAFDIRKGANR